jgi:hypothetical protein
MPILHPHSWIFKLWFMRPYNGLVLGRHIFFSGAVNEPVLAHEMVHQRQMDRHGVWGFYLRYVWEYITYRLKGYTHYNAYRALSFEREARGEKV